MSRNTDWQELDPTERRVALMRAAGMSEQTIGHFLETDYIAVSRILQRPRVARYLITIESTFVNDIRESARKLDVAITNAANRAFHIEKEVMENLFAQKESVRAQLGAATTAQDILDRAGKRAPTRIQTEVTHTIDAEALGRVASVLREHQAIDVTPRRVHEVHEGAEADLHQEGEGDAGSQAESPPFDESQERG